MNLHKIMALTADKNLLTTTGDCLVGYFLMLIMALAIAGCSGGDLPPPDASSTTSPSATTANANLLFLSPSKTSILSDDIDSVTITATVVNQNVAQENILITFKASGGVLEYAEAITNASGKATVTLKSGPLESNQVITITATSSLGVTSSIPIQITGNAISLSIPQNNLAISSIQTLSATLQNAKPIGISGVPVSFTILSGGGVVSLSSAEVTSNFAGVAQINITGLTTGTAIIEASSMGATAQITVTVSAAIQVFEITAPAISPAEMATDESLVFTVNAPTQQKVTFTTTNGIWNSVPGQGQVTIDVSGGVATATLTSTVAGLANITVYDWVNFSTQDSFEVEIYAPASQATQITLQASQTNVAPTPVDATSKNSVTLTATVKTVDDQAVGNAVVNFSITDPVGAGEQVSPASAQTDSSGVATTTFFSGSRSSDSNGVTITATIAGIVPTASDSVNIIIGQAAGSIVFGRSNKIIKSADNTYYTQNITAQVSDSNGNPVADAIVSLKLWPTHYRLGYENPIGLINTCYAYNDWPKCSGIFAQPNEDQNKNLVLDTTEDTGPYDNNTGTMVPDGLLTPHNSTAGSIPATVTTDADGFASFQHKFLKQYALWVRVQMQASVKVLGSETQAVESWTLPGEAEEVLKCQLFNSPFGYYVPTLSANAGPDQTIGAVGTQVQLNGASIPSGCAQTWTWTFTSVPAGSTITSNNLSMSADPTFTPDVAGNYNLLLSITNSGVTATDTVTITVL